MTAGNARSALVSSSVGHETPDLINQRASVWMKRGLALLGANTPASLNEAISNFNNAIALRRTLLLEGNSLFRYGLAAGWMNRGDALTQLGSPEELADALRSYDTALEVLRDLPLDNNPLFRRRVAIAWQNRGLTLQRQNNARALVEAGRSFARAIATLQTGNAAAIVDRDYLLAIISLNYANVCAGISGIESVRRARISAQEAMFLTEQRQRNDLALAEVSLKARHILCQANAEMLVGVDPADPARGELIAEATDAVEEGLALARSWEGRGVRRFRPLARDLFRFGARVYQQFQPHFLTEFLLENLEPAHGSDAFARDAEICAAAWESLWRTFREIQRNGFTMLNTPQFSELLSKLRELRIVEELLTELNQCNAAATGMVGR